MDSAGLCSACRWALYVSYDHMITYFSCCIYSVVDNVAAWDEMMSLVDFGNGNSKSNSLFFCATRPILNETVKKKIMNDLNTHDSGFSSGLCSDSTACDAIGMQGRCCPTQDGVYLGCCPAVAIS